MIHIPLGSSRKKESKRHGCERSFTSDEWKSSFHTENERKSSFPTPLGSSQPARWRRALLLLLDGALPGPERRAVEVLNLVVGITGASVRKPSSTSTPTSCILRRVRTGLEGAGHDELQQGLP